MTESPSQLIRHWLARQLPGEANAWLHEQLEKLSSDPADRDIHIALGMIPRRLGRDDLNLSADDLAQANAARPGWDPSGWSLDEAARILVLCQVGEGRNDFAALFTDLCQTADLQESIALYKGLPLYPAPETLIEQAAEGLRSNMRAVFDAVAHDSPFPRENFDENGWNQMVLKAMFVGSTLNPIQGLDDRANPVLAGIMCDFAHERWAASRPLPLEIWRCVGPFAEGKALRDLERALSSDNPQERRGAALALAASPAPEAKSILASMPDLAKAIETGALTWSSLASSASEN